MLRSLTRRSPRRRLLLESLERREVLAGNVTASVVGATLTLKGDGADNSLAIVALGNNRFTVTGLNTTINGSTAAFSPNQSIFNITGNLGGGNDNLGLTNNAQGLDTLATSAGLDLEATTGLTVAQMQARIDAVTTVNTFALSGSLTVQGGAGNDLIGIVGNVAGSVIADLGSANAAGGNALGIDGTTVAGGVASVGGVLSVTGGSQVDGLILQNAKIGGSVIANLGAGNDSLKIDNAQIRAALSALLGNGNDQLDIDGLDALSATILAGAGEDVLTIDDAHIDVCYANLGAGNDTATLTQSSGKVATIDGSRGTDRLNIDNVTLAAIAHLFKLGLETEQVI